MGESGLDALELEHMARRRGLPRPIAAAIGRIAARSGPPGPHRAEVLEELIAHFEDGLAAGRPAGELLEEFGEADLRQPSVVSLQSSARTSGDHRMSRLVADLRYAGRRILGSPGFTLIAILSLSLGIGATTAVFSLVNAIILRETPIRAPEEVVDLYESSRDFHYNVFSYVDFLDVERGTREVFSQVAGSRLVMAQVSSGGGSSQVVGELVTGSYFQLLGIQPALGRPLGPEDDVTPEGHPVVVLGNGYWRRALGASPDVVSQPIQLNGRAYTIVGIAPESYQGNIRGIVPDFFAPIKMANHLNPSEQDQLQSRTGHSMFVRGRLRPGVSIAAATITVLGIATELRRLYPEEWRADNTFILIPTKDVILFPGVDGVLYPVAALLLTLVGLVLLVVCANLASFLLARAVDRRREIAVRLALGATRGRLLAQLLTETVTLGLFGGAGGLFLAMLLTRGLTSANLPLPIAITLDLGIDGRVLAFATAISLAAGILFGLIPALRASDPNIVSTLRDESAGGGRRGRVAIRNGLVLAQVAVSMVLLIAAGLFVRSHQAVRDVDPGFGRESSGLLNITFPPARYPRAQALIAERQLASRIRELPGVSAVGIIDNLPLNLLNTEDTELGVPGVEPPSGETGYGADVAVVDTGFFAAAGIPLFRGRDFGAEDAAEAPMVAIVNEVLARRMWPDRDAVGSQLTRGSGTYEIVGVVAPTKIRSLGEDPRSAVYFPLAQSGGSGLWFLARTTGNADRTALAMLRVAQEMDRELIPLIVRSMERHLAVVQLPMRLAALVISSLALLAVVLAAIGLYGMVSYAVAQRTREVGIRLALGADAGGMVRMLMSSGLRLVIWGIAVGLVVSLLLARLVSRLLFGVGSLDPLTFVGVPVLLFLVAAVAAWLPARRVSRVVPTEALRSEG